MKIKTPIKLAIPIAVAIQWKVALAPENVSPQERDFAVREVRRAETALCYS